MKTKWVLCAVTALTAFIAAFDVVSALKLSDGLANYATGRWSSTFTNWLLEHYRLIVIAKPAVSMTMLIW